MDDTNSNKTTSKKPKKGRWSFGTIFEHKFAIIGVLFIVVILTRNFLLKRDLSLEDGVGLFVAIVCFFIDNATSKNASWGEWAREQLSQHMIAAIGIVVSFLIAIPDIRERTFSLSGAFGLFIVAFFYFVDAAQSASSDREKITDKLNQVEASTDLNTRVLRAHEHILATRTTDNLTLVAFKNLLAYLPFYLAEDLGYFQDEHIEITTPVSTLDDETTAETILHNPRSAVAICDPYMCVIHRDLQVIYPICHGIAAWPMTLNWIGSVTAAQSHVQIAAYKAPSTTHVLAQFVAKKVLAPLLANSSGISSEIIELPDDEARFGEDEHQDDIKSRLGGLLRKYDVTMLWEPHCELAMTLGARYLHRNIYEKALLEFDFPIMYSALIMSRDLIRTNPTLPVRLRRALDRAVARLQDPNRLKYCEKTLTDRRLLNGFSPNIRESVLNRLVASMPHPVDTIVPGTAGWNAAMLPWAEGVFAADKLRQSVVQNDPQLAAKLQVGGRQYGSAGDYRRMIFSQDETGGG